MSPLGPITASPFTDCKTTGNAALDDGDAVATAAAADDSDDNDADDDDGCSGSGGSGGGGGTSNDADGGNGLLVAKINDSVAARSAIARDTADPMYEKGTFL